MAKKKQTAKSKIPSFTQRKNKVFAKICECSGLESGILSEVVELAIELSREGREGRKVGTIFAVGDSEAVKKHSRPLILDPLARHPMHTKHISDPNLRETVKELAQLDGGFIVDGEGYFISAARYFDATSAGIEIHLGLGARHMAGASISKITKAVAVVVSESSGVRIFCGGELSAEILPELWLLSRFSSHIKKSVLTQHPTENIAIVSQD